MRRKERNGFALRPKWWGFSVARPSALRFVILPLSATLAGCTGIQSMLDPHGPVAETIADLAWIMFAGAALIFLLVICILFYGLFSRPERRHPLRGSALIVGGGLVLPVVTLSILLFYVFRIGAEIDGDPLPNERVIVEVTAYQWWWEFRYLDPDTNQAAVTANELHVPVGVPVELRLESADVIHSFWAPNLAGKRDVIPGQTNRLVIEAADSGIFRGQCNEFCGAQHALMRFLVVSEPIEDFERWLAAQREPARPPLDPVLESGQVAFMSSGCPVCHTVRGTEARGKPAPDLTHFGSRLTIAAGTLKNTQGNREAWIISSQHIKPNNKMPNYPFDAPTLRALAAYLGSLE